VKLYNKYDEMNVLTGNVETSSISDISESMAVSAVITSVMVGKEVYHSKRLHDINVHSRIFSPVSVVSAP
jgi:hypothetical protein